ncbi:MAG: alpha/beta fold hydrolase [Acidimicrobiia bacterium]
MSDARLAEPQVDVLQPVDGESTVTSVALVLHGGRERSHAGVKPGNLAVRRMRPFARELSRTGSGAGLAVWSLRHRVRGWNGDEQSPVADATWALNEIARRHGDVPVALVGHSMGGRTAVHVGGAPNVIALCLLAPWLPRGEPYEQVAGRSVLVVHGRLDTTTSPKASLAWAKEASTVSDRVWRVDVRRERHAMLWRPGLWHRLATDYTVAALGLAPMPPLLSAAAPEDRLEIVV